MRRPAAAFLLLHAVAWGQATFAVVHAGPSTLEIDTRHGSGNIFEFLVTNNAPVLDYITIQRSQVRSNGQEVLGVPSPEYGVSIPSGRSARMWFRWDLVGQLSPGSHNATIPFKSELNGQTVTMSIGFVVRAASLGAPATLAGSVLDDSGNPIPGATLGITDIGTAISHSSTVSTTRGAYSVSLTASDYAVTVDAAGYGSKTSFLTVAPGQVALQAFRLRALEPTVNAGTVTSTVVNVPSSIWTMRASADATISATAPMSSREASAFHGVHNGREAWRVGFPGISGIQGTVSQFQATDCDAAVSADGKYAAGMDYVGKVYVMDAVTGQVKWLADRAEDRNPLYPANSALGVGFFTCGAVAFSHDGSLLAAGGSNGWLVTFDVTSGAVRWNQAYSAEIRALRFSEDGSRLAVGAGDWKFRMLDARSGQLLWAADNQFWPLFFVAMDEAGTLVGSGSKEAEFRLWDAHTGELKWSKEYPAGAFVSGGGIFPGLNKVYVSDWTLGLRAYDLTGKELWFRRINNASMAVTADGRYVFAAGRSVANNSAAPVLYLLDENGTVLWENRPDTTANCRVQAPFASDFFKSTAVAREGDRIRAVAACVGGSVFTFEIPLAAAARPSISAVLHAASFGARLSAGTFASVFGENLESGSVRIAGKTVAPYFASEKQLNFLVPGDLPVGPSTMTIATAAGVSNTFSLQLESSAPGIFYDTGSGYGAILVAGTGITTAVRPGRTGDFLEIYCSGVGTAVPMVTITGIDAPVQFSGPTPVPGLHQVNVRIPAGITPGEHPLVLRVGGQASNAVKVRIGN